MADAGTAMLLVGLEPETGARLAASARNLVFAPVAADPQAVRLAVAGHPPAAALVSLQQAPELDISFEVISSLSRDGTPVIAVGPSKDADLILRAMRAGAREYVVAGDEAQLASAVQARARGEAAGEGRVVAVFAARGGVGATAVAANVAGALARRGERTCLLDLDLAFGDALSQLDLPGAYGVGDLVANMHRLDRDLLDASVQRHASGLWVVGRGERIEESAQVRAHDVSSLLAFLRRHYRHVVVDGVRAFDELSLAALDAGERILVLVTQDVPAVRNARRALEVFRRLGYDPARVELVVNRFHRASRITPDVLRESVGIPVRAVLANDFAAASRAVDRGVLLSEAAPRSPLTRDLEALAAHLQGPSAAAPASRPLLRRLFGRS